MITGGTGFLGSYLVKHLVEEKGIADVVLYDQYPNESRIADVRDRITLEQGSVLEPFELLHVMARYQVDHVIHLAFILGDPDQFKPVTYLNVQCMGTANVAPIPNTMCGACKLWGEHIAKVYTNRYGLDIISLRPCSVFGLGRGQRGSYASGLTPLSEQPHFMVLPERAALGEAVQMPPDNVPVDWIYAADAAEAWYLAMTVERPQHRVFNLRAERRQMGEMTSYLRQILPEAQIDVGTGRPRSLYLLNNDRLVNELGFKARWSMETGLVDYLNLVRGEAGLPPIKGHSA